MERRFFGKKIINMRGRDNITIKGCELSPEHARTIIYFFSEVLSKAASLMLLPFLSFVMLPADYGLVGIIIPIIQMLQGAAICGLSVSQLRSYADRSYSHGDIHLNMMVCAVCWFLICFSVLGLTDLLDLTLLDLSMAVLFLLTFLQSINLFNLQRCQFERRAFSFLLYSNTPRVGLIACLFVAWFLEGGVTLNGVLLSYGLSGLTVLILTVLHFRRSLAGSFRRELINTFLLIGLPLAVNSCFALLLHVSGRIVLMSGGDVESLAVYTFCIGVSNAVFFVVAVYNRMFIPDLFDRLSNRKDLGGFLALNGSYGSWVLVLALIFLNGVVVVLLKVHTDLSYREYLPIAALTLLPGVSHMLYNIGLNILSYDKKTIWVLLINVVSGLLSLFCNWYFYLLFGIYGVVISQAILMTIMSGAFFVIALRIGQIQTTVTGIIRPVIWGVILLLLLSYITTVSSGSGYYLSVVASIVSLIVAFIVFYKKKFLLVLK